MRRNVEALRGSVRLASRPGEGTTVSLAMPLTLAIIQGFSVEVGGETCVVPLESVIECVELPESERRDRRDRGVMNLRGEPLPYLRLRRFLGLPGEEPPRENVVVIRHAASRAGLAVDALLGEGQTVVKPLSSLFRRAPGVCGTALLGNGRVALILEVSDLLERALEAEPSSPAVAAVSA